MAKVTAKKYSDLDLCYYDVPNLVIGDIREELEKSDLPFVVELVNWKNMRPTFQKNIEKDLVLISAPTKNKKTKKINSFFELAPNTNINDLLSNTRNLLIA